MIETAAERKSARSLPMKRFTDPNRGAAVTRTAVPALLILFGVISFLDASAQQRPRASQGRLALLDWPESRPGRPAETDFADLRLLPFIDSLTVGYRFEQVDDRATIAVALEWTPADHGVLDGRRVARDRLPEDIIIESIDLLAQVVVDDKAVADFFLPLDTLRLGPSPSVALIDVRGVEWDAVFSETDARAAREIFESGFSLRNLRILRVVFSTDSHARMRTTRERTDERTTVFVPDVDIWLTWGRRPRWNPPVTLITRSGRERRDEVGRPDLVERERPDRGYDRPDEADEEPVAEDSEDQKSDERSARRKGRDEGGSIKLPGSGNDDDDDDDEDRLLPAALAGAALIGGLAVLGGTFGYMGNADKAPIGLMAGRVMPRGGVLAHVAVNRQVFGKASGPENLIAGITGFGDLLGSRLQPAIGVGVRVTEEGTQSTRTIPTLSAGFVANLNMLILHAAYDIEAGDVRFGVGVNLRGPRGR